VGVAELSRLFYNSAYSKKTIFLNWMFYANREKYFIVVQGAENIDDFLFLFIT
jgi:hypothetical protein